MRRTLTVGLLAALGPLALGGCGTCANLFDSGGEVTAAKVNRVYGGVQLDLIEAENLRTAPPSGPPESTADQLERIARRAYLLGIDVPLSCVADTVTLPLTAMSAWESKYGAPSGLSSGQVLDNYVSPVRASATPPVPPAVEKP